MIKGIGSSPKLSFSTSWRTNIIFVLKVEDFDPLQVIIILFYICFSCNKTLRASFSYAAGMSSMIGLPTDRALVEDDECLRFVILCTLFYCLQPFTHLHVLWIKGNQYFQYQPYCNKYAIYFLNLHTHEQPPPPTKSNIISSILYSSTLLSHE